MHGFSAIVCLQIKTCCYIPEKRNMLISCMRKRENMKKSIIPDRMLYFLWGLVALTVLFSGLILFIPLLTLKDYHFISNLFEVIITLVCMISSLYVYKFWSERVLLLLAAFAFGGYALSNTFWFLYTEAFPNEGTLFNVSELGFLGVMLFFIVGFRIEFPKKPCPASWRIASGGLLFFILALTTLGRTGINKNPVLSLAWLLIIALFIDTALNHGVYRHPLLWEGVCLWSFTSILYELWYNVVSGIVDTSVSVFFAPSPLPLGSFFDIIIGPLSFLSLLLLQLGIFEYLNSPED